VGLLFEWEVPLSEVVEGGIRSKFPVEVAEVGEEDSWGHVRLL